MVGTTSHESFGAKGEQVPAVAAHEGAWKRVEGADKKGIERDTLPTLVKPRLYREPFGHDPDVAKPRHQLFELADAEGEQHGSVFMLKRDVHELSEGIQPRNPVVDLEHGRTP